MRVATGVLSLILLASCSGAGGGRASGSPVVSSGSRAVASPTTKALRESPIDLTSLSGRIVFDNIDLPMPTQAIWPPGIGPPGDRVPLRRERVPDPVSTPRSLIGKR